MKNGVNRTCRSASRRSHSQLRWAAKENTSNAATPENPCRGGIFFNAVNKSSAQIARAIVAQPEREEVAVVRANQFGCTAFTGICDARFGQIVSCYIRVNAGKTGHAPQRAFI
jgi:hypothetical protein